MSLKIHIHTLHVHVSLLFVASIGLVIKRYVSRFYNEQLFTMQNFHSIEALGTTVTGSWLARECVCVKTYQLSP